MTEDKDKKLEEIIEQNAQEKITINIPKKQEQPAPQIKEFEDIDSGDDVVIEEQVLDEQADEQQLEQPKHIKPKSKGFNTAIIALIIVGCSIISSIIGLGILNDVLALYKQDIDIIIVIPKNASTGQISQILKDNKIINLEFAFRIVSRLNKADGTYQYGEYTLNPRMSYPTIISKLQKPAVKRETVRVALIEGTSIVKMAMILEDNGVCTAKDFLDIANRENFGFDFEKEISNNPLKFQRVEGFIMPDTYEFYINDSPYNVAKKIFSRFNDKFSADLKDRMKQLGMTLEETIIFASIVQNEAPVLSEMKKVAGVFHNRVKDKKNFPRFESDTTHKYIREVIKPNLLIDNDKMILAYDSYKTAGYPPSAICNPGIEAIKATLYPEEVPYLYFCSNLVTQQFFYANTLEEHNVNLRKAGLR